MFGADIWLIVSARLPKPIYRPFRADAFLNRYLGLKPQAESYCSFGAETLDPDFAAKITPGRPISGRLFPLRESRCAPIQEQPRAHVR